MFVYILARIVAVIPVLFIASVFVFSVLHLIPGDPVDALLGDLQDPIVREALKKDLGLDKNLVVQYGIWMWKVLHLDFGVSIRSQMYVKDELYGRLPRTIYLSFVSIIISTLLAIPAGVIAAVHRKTLRDYIAQVWAVLGISMPSFWFGILLMLLFSLYLRWLPTSGYVSPSEDFWLSLRHLFMPALTLGWILSASITRLTRSTMLDELSKDYVRTAKSQGIPERTIQYKLALKNAMIPVTTILGLRFAGLLGGTAVIEQLFNWPGVGSLVVQAIYFRDYPVVQASILNLAIAFVFMNLVVDILYKWLDPRIRLQ
ncbi:MAG: ABC transporter permease [Candidatus Tectomicrobia bacterium]|nr:ABC transporter permease [Candidatus Tectomicrobia bacterium]